ncbi:MAG: HAMP domain-containing protein [Calditrichaeota bacterium]|nr:MAG: HAMP domain-containing protein [Calditrichota bacterium]
MVDAANQGAQSGVEDSVRRRFALRFSSLPIRFKLSLMIGLIVVSVVLVFSLIVLHRQRAVLMARMTQVCRVLIQNLSETAKGDLILNNHNRMKEAALRLVNTRVEGLVHVAVLDRNARPVASFGPGGQEIAVDIPGDIFQFQTLSVVEKPGRFDYYNPIYTERLENDRPKQILLGYALLGFSKRTILAPIRQARNIALSSALLISIFSIFVIYVVARQAVSQIQLLSEGAKLVGQGNLNIQIEVNSQDELGQLAQEFNNMTQHLREKLQMQKFVSKLTVDMIRDSVRTLGTWSRAGKRNVTVLFSDVRDFSSVAEKLAPEEIVKLINIYFDLQTRVIEAHDGIVDKFMGDQIMAIFQGRNMADNALRAAVEIQRQIRGVNQERQALGLVTLETGIGINSGAAVMGHMGSSHRMDYTVIGDVVNVAARLCAAAGAGQIITSLHLAKKVNGSYPTTRLKSISVKGRSKPISVCEIDYDRDILT